MVDWMVWTKVTRMVDSKAERMEIPKAHWWAEWLVNMKAGRSVYLLVYSKAVLLGHCWVV